MTPADLARAIDRHEIPSILVLYGEETFLLERLLQRLLDSVVTPENRDFNLQILQGKETTATLVNEAVRTYPVFASQRLVLVKDVHLLPATETEQLLPLLRTPIQESVLVFTAEKVDARRKFYAELKKQDALVEFKRLYDNQLPAQIKEISREFNLSLTEDAMALFCRRVNTSLREVYVELEKLSTYTGDRKLADKDDVAAVVSQSRQESIFELNDALGQRNVKRALTSLEGLLNDGTPGLVVLSMVVRHFRTLWKIHELHEQRSPRADIIRTIGVNPYFFDGMFAQAKQFSAAGYRQIFDKFIVLDLALKSAGSHPSAMLEQLIVDICKLE